MTLDNPTQGETPANEPAKVAAPSRLAPVSVDQCGLQLTGVKLIQLLLTRVASSDDAQPVTKVSPQGEFVVGSLNETGFLSHVSWSLRVPGGNAPPISISGKHELVFAVKQPIASEHAEYYSVINSVILAYPYIRQVIDEMSTKCLGRNVMIPPLDVPKFVADSWRAMEQRESEAIEAGNGTDVEEVTG